MASTRRLAAILPADVAGYWRLMGADEEGTHERLKAHLRQLVDPKIREHRGRVVKNTGDGFLARHPDWHRAAAVFPLTILCFPGAHSPLRHSGPTAPAKMAPRVAGR